MKQETNGNQYVQTSNPVNSVTGTNTLQPANQFTQTSRPRYSSVATGTDMLHDRQIQTVYPLQNNMGTETSMYRDRNVQTNEIRSVDNSTGMTSSIMGQDISSNMMESRNMMGQDLYSNAMENNNKMMSSNILMGGNMNQMTPLSRMSQRMQIETMPSQSLNRFF